MNYLHSKSPLYICSLDEEKCFDTIWHKALFYKLYGIIPNADWLLLFRWYSSPSSFVRWKGTLERAFDMTKDTTQGSSLSPCLFNTFIYNLLLQLDSSIDKTFIGSFCMNAFAYPDDISLVCPEVPCLQHLIDHCSNSACKWIFHLGIKKTISV